MEKTFILPSYISSSIRIELERTSIQKMKEQILDACKTMDNSGFDTTAIQAAITNISDEPSLDDIMPVYTVLEHYGDINKDDPKKTVYNPKYDDITGHLDTIQTAVYNIMLKIKFAQGYDYVRVYDPVQGLELENHLEKLMLDTIGFRDLFHLSLEGIRSGSAGLDEIENGIRSLYLLSEILTGRFIGIKEEFFA